MLSIGTDGLGYKVINYSIIIWTLKTKSLPLFTKGRNYPSLVKRGEGEFYQIIKFKRRKVSIEKGTAVPFLFSFKIEVPEAPHFSNLGRTLEPSFLRWSFLFGGVWYYIFSILPSGLHP
jgi:hypothetical protein